MRLFVVAVVCVVFSTRRRRLLAMPGHRWIHDEAPQLVVAGGALAVDGAGACRSYSCGSLSSPLAALCTRRVGGDDWHCQPAARCVRIDSLRRQAMLSLSMAVASEEAAGAALRRRRGLLGVLNSTAARLLAMPVRRSRCTEARRLVLGGFMFTTRRRRLLELPTRRILRAETRQLGAASRASRRR